MLSGWLTQKDMRPDPVSASFGLGRNCTIFDELRAFSYREAPTFKRSGRSAEAWRARLFNVARNASGLDLPPKGRGGQPREL